VDIQRRNDCHELLLSRCVLLWNAALLDVRTWTRQPPLTSPPRVGVMSIQGRQFLSGFSL
jgi:hypothetical protein